MTFYDLDGAGEDFGAYHTQEWWHTAWSCDSDRSCRGELLQKSPTAFQRLRPSGCQAGSSCTPSSTSLLPWSLQPGFSLAFQNKFDTYRILSLVNKTEGESFYLELAFFSSMLPITVTAYTYPFILTINFHHHCILRYIWNKRISILPTWTNEATFCSDLETYFWTMFGLSLFHLAIVWATIQLITCPLP